MRVHRLELTAFGPFPETEVIDFDELNDAGVFLLTGHTGAGKTSILDAICFGLFGSVPGDRNNAKDLRSHHAPPDAVPVVELEVTLRGRRFVLRRSPAWSKPSRRAKSGHVDQNAQARASELVNGTWVPLSSRVDEVSHLVTRVLGMSRDQFCQVVMLPQGQFQTFLKSGAKERHDVLEALFETGRFVRIEKWLGDHRRACDQRCAAHEATLREVLARLEEANDAPLLEVPAVAVDDQSAPWADYARAATELRELTRAALVDTQQALAAAYELAKVAEHALDEAKTLSDRQARHAEAQQELASLDAIADVVRDRAVAIEKARAAQSLHPLLVRVEESRAQLAESTSRSQAVADRLAMTNVQLSNGDLDEVDGLVGALGAELASLDSILAIETEAASLEAELDSLRATHQQHRGRLAELEQQSLEAPTQLEAARAELDASRHLADSVDQAQRAAQRAESVLAAAYEAAKIEHELVILQRDVDAARIQALQTREDWLTVRERYLDSLAAILAGELNDGCACPVCGSADHPVPAAMSPDHVTADQEATALTTKSAADQIYAEVRDVLDEARRRHSDAVRRAGGMTVDAALAARDDTAAEASRAEQAADDLVRLSCLVAEVSALTEALGDTVAELSAKVAAGDTLAEEWSTRLADRRATVVAAIGADSSVQDRIDIVRDQLNLATSLMKSLRDVHDRSAVLLSREEQLDDALDASPLDTRDEIRTSMMTKPELANEEALIRSAADRRAAAVQTLAEPALLEAIALPAPALESWKGGVDAAQAELMAASSRADRISERLERLDQLGAEFVQAVSALLPLQSARDLAVRVAAMCAGTSPDNQTRTKLSHYVLGARLQQVVDAANIRLGSISAGRYQLEHQMARSVGDTRGGLGLRVLDTYTGQKRDPATLSGGETFYVSLALALGLADLVRDEIGGVELSTLFVDEGFGSLDSETLDEVMDELDSLRSGGRAVGIVSHLSELRQRIPMRVHVAAGPAGSCVVSS